MSLPAPVGRGGRVARPRLAALLLAVGLDLAAGEPRDPWHPVAWVGRALAWAERRAGRRTVAAGVAAAAGGGAALLAALARRAGRPGVLLEALALKPAFAVRRLAGAARDVASALRAGDLAAGRRSVGRHLVSRATGALAAGEVASAAIESLAENLTDSVAAPLCAYALGGLPAAWIYRVVNTADAMWGYRDARYAEFGRAAARLDDVANLVPGRLAAAALAAGAAIAGEGARAAVRVAWRDHGRTASPNAGWPMAAMAGALAVGLAKPGAYRLGDAPLPESSDAIGRAVRVFAAAAALVVAASVGIACARGGRR